MSIIINPRQIIKDGITSLRDVWSSSKVSAELSGKQATLVSGTNIKTINNTSLLGSGDITISGGGDIPKINMTATTATLDPNKFYVWGEVASLDISLAAETAGIQNVYKFQFQSGSTATTLTLPSSVKWSERNTPTIFRNTTYIISIESGIAKIERMFTSSLLPADYQQVEWIESDGTACMKIPFDFSSSINRVELVVYNPANNDGYCQMWPSLSAIFPGFGLRYMNDKISAWIGATEVMATIATIGRHLVVYDDTTAQWSVDGVVIASNYQQSSLSTYSFLGMWTIVQPNGDVYRNSYKGKIGRLFITTGTNNINLIPCYHIQSGIKGLYDIISDAFYINFRSSGNFNIGPDV